MADAVAVFREVARVRRPGGRFVVTFSNRCFPTKAIRGWLATDDAGHVQIVNAYFDRERPRSGSTRRVNGRGPGYAPGVIPDDAAGRPLTPDEQAAIADLERQLLLDAPAPVRNLAVVRPARLRGSARRRSLTPPAAAGPLIALLATACALLGLLGVIGVGVLGAAAVLVSVAATAVVWSLLPARFGGPARRLLYRRRGRLPHRSS